MNESEVVKRQVDYVVVLLLFAIDIRQPCIMRQSMVCELYVHEILICTPQNAMHPV